MGSDTTVLAFDTSAAHCAAALLLGDRVFVTSEALGRGQAERLMPLIEELLRGEGLGFADLDRIGVGIGPGNFTGIRISVSAARGLALGLGIPAIGVSCLAALRALSVGNCAAIVAPRETAYVQIGDADPAVIPVTEVPGSAQWLDQPDALATSIARLAQVAPPDGPSPAPLYLKPADAAPSRDAPPVMLK